MATNYTNVFNGGFRGIDSIMRYASNETNTRSNERMHGDMLEAREAEFQRNMEFNMTKWKDEYAETVLNGIADRETQGAQTERLNKRNDADVRSLDGETKRLDDLGVSTIRNNNNRTDSEIRNNNNSTDANVRSLDARTSQQVLDTEQAEQTYDIEINGRLAANMWADIEVLGGPEKAMEDPMFMAKYRTIMSKNPALKKYVAENHKMDPETVQVAGIETTGANAISGVSLVNGEATVATADNGTLSEDPNTKGMAFTDMELIATITALGMQSADFKSPAALKLMADMELTNPDDVAAVADVEGNLKQIKAATAGGQAEQGQGQGQGGTGLRGMLNSVLPHNLNGAAPQTAAPTPAPAPAPAQGLSREERNYRAALGASAAGMTTNEVADAAAGRGLGQAEAEFQRSQEGHDNTVIRRDYLDDNEFTRDETSADNQAGRAENAAGNSHLRSEDSADSASKRRMDEARQMEDLRRPNGDIINAAEREELIKVAGSKEDASAIEDATAYIDVDEDVGWFWDKDFETYRNAGSPAANTAKMYRDLSETMKDPTNQRMVEPAIGPMPTQPGEARRKWKTEAYKIVLLARSGDRDNMDIINWGFRDRKTLGQIPPSAVKKYMKQQRPNNVN